MTDITFLRLVLMVRVFCDKLVYNQAELYKLENYLYYYNLHFWTVIRALTCAAPLAYFKKTNNQTN